MSDDDTARRARAERLRRQIAEIKSGVDEKAPATEDTASAEVESESADQQPPIRGKKEKPRDFIQRRMRELNQQPKPDSSKDEC